LTFLVVALKTQAYTAKLTTSTLKISPAAQQKCPEKSLPAPPGVHLQLLPVITPQFFFSAL